MCSSLFGKIKATLGSLTGSVNGLQGHAKEGDPWDVSHSEGYGFEGKEQFCYG